VGERAHHLTDDTVATVPVEGWVEGVEDAVMGLTVAFPIADGLLVVSDVVGEHRTAVVLDMREYSSSAIPA